MIGKPEWFQRRKYGGWGIHPKTWQGVLYIICFLLPFVIFNLFTIWTTRTRIIVAGAWILLLIIDVIDIMRKLKMDERERIHEALSERNALWGVLVVLIMGVFYDLINSSLQQKIYVNPFIAGALVVAVIIKAISNTYLEKKD